MGIQGVDSSLVAQQVLRSIGANKAAIIDDPSKLDGMIDTAYTTAWESLDTGDSDATRATGLARAGGRFGISATYTTQISPNERNKVRGMILAYLVREAKKGDVQFSTSNTI